MNQHPKHQYLASSCGFCSGVTRALDLFHDALRNFGAPIYVLRELVHNNTVTESMAKEGAVFIKSIDDAPDGATLLLGAHGITRAVETQLAKRNLRIIDATCPLVQRLHNAVSALSPADDLILFGKSGHPESDGILSQSNSGKCHLIEKASDIDRLPKDLRNPIFLSQTTMNYRDCREIGALLKAKYPQIRIPADVCRASYDRQIAVEELAKRCDFIIVIGSPHSSNAKRLVEIAESCGVKAALAEGPEELPDVSEANDIGITAGASTPASLIHSVSEALKKLGYLNE